MYVCVVLAVVAMSISPDLCIFVSTVFLLVYYGCIYYFRSFRSFICNHLANLQKNWMTCYSVLLINKLLLVNIHFLVIDRSPILILQASIVVDTSEGSLSNTCFHLGWKLLVNVMVCALSPILCFQNKFPFNKTLLTYSIMKVTWTNFLASFGIYLLDKIQDLRNVSLHVWLPKTVPPCLYIGYFLCCFKIIKHSSLTRYIELFLEFDSFLMVTNISVR